MRNQVNLHKSSNGNKVVTVKLGSYSLLDTGWSYPLLDTR